MSVSTYRPRSKQFQVGDYVLLKNREGYIRYIGKREFHHGCWYGLELARGHGPNDGAEHGKRYFACKDRRGIFVRLYAIKKKLTDPRHKIPNVNTALPLLPQSKTVSEARSQRSHKSLHSDSSLSHTPSPSGSPNTHHLKLDSHTHTSNSPRNTHIRRPGSTRPKKSSKNNSNPWRNNTPNRRPKSARASKANKKAKFALSPSPRRKLKHSKSNGHRQNRNKSRNDNEVEVQSITDETSDAESSESSKEMFTFTESNIHRQKHLSPMPNTMHRANSVSTPKKNGKKNSKKRNRSKSKNPKKKRKTKPKKAKKARKIHDRRVTDIDGMKNVYSSLGNAKGNKKQRNILPKLKEINRILKYNKRQSFHRRKSRTVDFDISTHTQQELRQIMQNNITDSSSDDDDDDDITQTNNTTNKNTLSKSLPIPVLKSPKTNGKYTFRLHIKNNEIKGLNAPNVNGKQTRNGNREYNLILPHSPSDPIPVKLKQNYTLTNGGQNGPNLSLSVNDDDYYDNIRPNNGPVRKRTDSGSSSVAYQYNINEDLNTGISTRSLHSQIETNKLSMLKKDLYELNLLPDTPMDTDSDILDNAFDDILFISQNSKKNIHTSDSMSDIKEEEEMPPKNRQFEIEESVIEYHVPSKPRQKHKNIKINIHINNDINSEVLKGKGKHSNHSRTSHSVGSRGSMNADLGSKHEINPSITSSQTLLKKKTKKKKKHSHNSHRHRTERHKKHTSKKGCSCHKHAKDKKERDRGRHRKKGESKAKKEKVKDRKSKQIKFRKKGATPKNAMPPPPISPRNGYNMQRYDWTGLI